MLYSVEKKILDVLGAILGILFILPFFPLIAIAIWFEDGGSVVIKLPRISAGKIIGVYKFRSMRVDAHEEKKNLFHLNERGDGPFFKIKNDPRLTKVGKVIRKFRLDEFPQLINVLRGELSLVGPRPHEEAEVEKYPKEFEFLKFEKAGVTGLSQVNGASSLPFLRELELDSFYVKNKSLWMDLKIIFKTLSVLFFDPTAI